MNFYYAMKSLRPGGLSADALHAGNARMYVFLLLLTVASVGGLQGWRSLINNFSVDVAGLDGFDFGIAQSVREIPGFLSLLVIYLLLFVSEHRLAAVSVLLLGAGVAATGFFPDFYGIIFTTLLLSFGFHYFETLNQSLTLQYFDLSAAPLVFGRLKSVASGTNLVVGGLVFVCAGFMSFKAMFLCIGVVVLLLAACGLFMSPQDANLVPQSKKMIVKKRYWLFYALTFMAGARRQIFVAFAVFLLVERFGLSVRAVTALFIVNNVVNMFLSPMIGRSINRFGERAVLRLEYASLVLIFISYAFVDSVVAAGILYVLDHIFFNFAMAIRTYFQKIAAQEDIAPSMAVGFTINHIAAVIIPVLGGALWLLDYRMVFLCGAGLSLGSLLLTCWLPSGRKNGPSSP